MNAIKFLLKEHERFRRIFSEITDASHRDETRRKMLDELCADLLRHEKMEHRVWYPRLKSNNKLYDTIKHLISEEKYAEKVMKEFKKVKSQDEWDELFLKFKKDVDHHASEEETKLFPYVAKAFSETELEEIGKEMREFTYDFAK